jgi:hypothetical protein
MAQGVEQLSSKCGRREGGGGRKGGKNVKKHLNKWGNKFSRTGNSTILGDKFSPI